MRIKAEIDDIEPVVVKLENAARIDTPIKIFANTQLVRYCDPYVPASSSRMLAGHVNITEDYAQYPGPYGHYQYMGIVYGPNIPIFEGETLVGFFSIPGKPKTKTERKLNYSKDIHPLAQSHWDKAAMRRHQEDLNNDVKDYIVTRYKDGK